MLFLLLCIFLSAIFDRKHIRRSYFHIILDHLDSNNHNIYAQVYDFMPENAKMHKHKILLKMCLLIYILWPEIRSVLWKQFMSHD